MSNQSLSPLLDQAYESLYAGELKAARRLLDDARRLQAESETSSQKNAKKSEPGIALLEVDILLEEGADEEAVAAAEEAKQNFPHEMLVEFKYATLLLDTFDDVTEARPILESLFKRLEDGEHPNVDVENADKPDAENDFHLEVLLTLSDCRAADGDPQGALEAADRAVALSADDGMARLCRASALFELCDLDVVEAEITKALKSEPKMADAFWLRGRLLTAQADSKGAQNAFEKASALEPERFSAPLVNSKEAFQALIPPSLEELPPKVKTYLKGIPIEVEDIPAASHCLERGFGPGLLGLYAGNAPTGGQDNWHVKPDHITLFQRNLEMAATDADDLSDLISTTLLQEVLHFQGMDEEAVAEGGLEY